MATAVFILWSLPVHARPHKSEAWARSQFAAAIRLQQALESRPAGELTRADYERVISAYHRVYFEAPTSTKADPSVLAEAQLLEKMGRRFNDDDVLRSAIHQYQFLRQQYPGSKARFGALFRIGEIYQEDLHDKARARAAFEEFLQRYPRNQFADEARKALAEPVEKASLKSAAKPKVGEKLKAAPPDAEDDDEDSPDPAPKVASADSSQENSDQGPSVGPVKGNAKIARVTGVRHWSTPDSARVAIDLEHGVRFESQRIDHPDRVFFDLFDTRLDSTLVGKSFEVDNPLLKKIRISQFKPGQTRVVLEVDGTADFGASLLSDPPRLMIDVGSRPLSSAPETEAAPPSAQTKDETKKKSSKPAPADLIAENDSHDLPVKKENPGKIDARAPTPCADSADASKDCSTKTRGKSDKRVTFTTTTPDGVKKTIVDADAGDNENEIGAKRTAAKLDVPEIKPASKVASTVALSDPTQSRPAKGKRKAAAAEPDTREAQPTASGDRSLIRALGLKIGKIVIDPGHGGHDTGTIGPNGLEEKNLVLDVSQRLGKLLTTRLGAEVIYTRRDDTFIPLETRTAIANQEGADLFVSVHANSSQDPDARGVETYYLNFTSSAEALEVAARENAVSEKSIHELQDLVKKIALKEKIEESREFATDVESSLHSGLAAKNPGLRDRGVKKAPFIVLIGANMPSILAEVSFVSNPGDEKRLGRADYRQRIAESLYRGIAKYVNGLSGVKVASKIDKDAGQ